MIELHALDLPASDAADWVRDRAAEGLSAARAGADALKEGGVTSTREALVAWDEVGHRIDGVAAVAELYANVHPDEAVRELADQVAQDATRLSTALELDRDLSRCCPGWTPPRSRTARRPRGCSSAPCATSVVPAWTATTTRGPGSPVSARS